MRTWTPEERARQSELTRQQKPWLKSTGPRTAEGKLASSTNSTTHGMTSRAAKEFKRALLQHREFLKLIRNMDLIKDK